MHSVVQIADSDYIETFYFSKNSVTLCEVKFGVHNYLNQTAEIHSILLNLKITSSLMII